MGGVARRGLSKLGALVTGGGVGGLGRGAPETHYRAEPKALRPLVDWMSFYAAFWRDRFDRLEDLLRRMDQ